MHQDRPQNPGAMPRPGPLATPEAHADDPGAGQDILAAITARLRQAAMTITNRRIGYSTGVHPQTARRYLTGDRPSIEFIIAFCGAFDVSADWLLTGRGCMRWPAMRSWAWQTCTMSELCRLLGDAMDSADGRVSALEGAPRKDAVTA